MPAAARTARAAAAGVVLVSVGLATLVAAPANAASGYRLRIGFDSGESLSAGSRVRDTSGSGNNGVVTTGAGGTLRRVVLDNGSAAAKFPAKCGGASCGRGVVVVPDAPSLDPGTAPFSWGATVVIHANETSSGSNVVQKGFYGDRQGQWKLQVDGYSGKPSCLVSGYAGRSYIRGIARSSVSVADGRRHVLTCRRTGSGVTLYVDGIPRGGVAMPAVMLANSADVTIGGKAVYRKNDQYHGIVDDVFVTVG